MLVTAFTGPHQFLNSVKTFNYCNAKGTYIMCYLVWYNNTSHTNLLDLFANLLLISTAWGQSTADDKCCVSSFFLCETTQNFNLHATVNEAINSIYCKSPLLCIIVQTNTNSDACNSNALQQIAVEELRKCGQCDILSPKKMLLLSTDGWFSYQLFFLVRQNRVCALKTSEIKYKDTISIILRSNIKAPANTSATILIPTLVANSKCNPSLCISHSFISEKLSRIGTQAFIYPHCLSPCYLLEQSCQQQGARNLFPFLNSFHFYCLFPEVLAFPNATSLGSMSSIWSPRKSRGCIS